MTSVSVKGNLAILAGDLGHLSQGPIDRAKLIASLWAGPVTLVLARRPPDRIGSDVLPDRISLVLPDQRLEEQLTQATDRDLQRAAVRSLLSTAAETADVERLYVMADAEMIELLPAIADEAGHLPVDVELLRGAGVPDTALLWPYADGLLVADPSRVYPLATSRPALPVRPLPVEDRDSMRQALAELPGLSGRLRISVVMPTRGGRVRALRAVEAVLERTPELLELIVVDDASPDDTLEGVGERSHDEPRVRVLHNDRQHGFAATCNRGLAAARGDLVVVLGADTLVPHGWTRGLLEGMRAYPKAGALGPLFNLAPGLQQLSPVPYDTETLSGFDRFARKIARGNAGRLTPVVTLSGICLAMPRQALRMVGGFDPIFFPGGLEDQDWCARLRAAGWQAYRADSVFIHHEGATSLAYESASASELHERGWELFKEKWGLPVDRGLKDGYTLKELPLDTFDRGLHFIAPWKATEPVVG
jgi:GT2 family glycosyltransferase